MNSFKRATLVGICAVMLAACGSESAKDADDSGGKSPSASVSVPSPTPTPTVDPNDAACDSAQNLVTGPIRNAFNAYDTDNPFDPKFARRLRAGATKLYAVQRKANGAVADAIGAEAKGLVDLSVAVESGDDAAAGDAANAANSALAQLRGTCNF